MEKCYQRLLLALCVLLGLAVAATEQARALTLFPVAASPGAITAGPDGALWFTGDNGEWSEPDWPHHDRGCDYRIPDHHGL